VHFYQGFKSIQVEGKVQVMGEIADAHNMPFGLFSLWPSYHKMLPICPSIQIAIVLVIFLFLALIYAAFVTDFLQ